MLEKNRTPNLSVRLARDVSEIEAAQRLRYRVFVDELGAQVDEISRGLCQECDAFDAHVEHLCVFDQELEARDPQNAVVGVYRLVNESAARKLGGFYSQSEFDLTPILSQEGRKLELGRSCVAPQYRGGVAMSALWHALGDYIEENQIDTLFGTASYHGIELASKLQSLSHLHHEYLAEGPWRAEVLPESKLEFEPLPKDKINRLEAMRCTPSLLKSYLRWGGKIGNGAFLDRQFNTIDVFVIMDTKLMLAKYHALYGAKQ